MTRNNLTAILFSLLATATAHAGVFDVPYEHPALTIAVPGSWSPNHSDDGVDAAAPDNTVFFSIYTAAAKDAAAVQRESLAILSRNGMKIDKPADEHAASIAGLTWAESQYSASEDGKPRLVRLDASHLSGDKFIQLLVWGSPKGMKQNAASLQKILETIRLKAH